MKIGTIDLGERPVLLAPMEDVTDPSFRLICKEQGADMVYTEFVSADALVRNINSTTRKLHTNAAERPVAIQIYGKEVEPMVEAAKIAEAAGPDVIDINFGWRQKARGQECSATCPSCCKSRVRWSMR